MNVFARIASALLLALTTGLAAQAEETVLKAAVLQGGTVNWELDTIRHYGLDKANGFTLETVALAGNPATQVAFQGGEVDMIVTDWIWVARQRADGQDIVFVPYSTAVGNVLVKADSPAQTLADLKGKKIGIAGGPLDKSWLILRAYAQEKYGLDLAAESEQVFAAPPLVMSTAMSGETDAAINFWHFSAKMQARGMRPLISVAEAAGALGLDPQMPLLGYALKGEMARSKPELVAGLQAASRAAKEKLRDDPAAWDRLRDMMNAPDDADFEALKQGFIAGIPTTGPVDVEAAGRFLNVMARLGGEKLVGAATTLPEGVFVPVGN